MISAAPCVLDALLAMRAVAVHDSKNHVSLKVLDGRERMRGIQGFRSVVSLTPHFAQRVPSLRNGEESVNCVEGVYGGRTRSCGTSYLSSGERIYGWKGKEMKGGETGERERRQDGIIYFMLRNYRPNL